MWGDIGLITDIRFLGVAPHWYFRAYMGWLIFCPHHYIGIYGLILFFLIIYFQPFFLNYQNKKLLFSFQNTENSFINRFLIMFFIMNLLYTGSYLPCGKYFTELEGNIASTVAYLFIFIFLLFNLTSFFHKQTLTIHTKLIYTKFIWFI